MNNTNVKLKHEHTKVLDFFGEPSRTQPPLCSSSPGWMSAWEPTAGQKIQRTAIFCWHYKDLANFI